LTGPAFVVLAHKRPAQVARLAARLAPHPVYLHVDDAVSDDGYAAFAAAVPENVRLLPRHRSGWASWGLVAAALEGVRAALASGPPSHVMLLSGQDYPLRSAEAIGAFFAAHPETSFLPHWPLPSRMWGRFGGMDRLRVPQRPVRGRRVALPLPRRLPRGIRPYGGSMYWALTGDAAQQLLDACARRPDLVRFYRSTWIPDEMFVPTVVMNSAAARGQVADEALTYIRWPDPGGRHPALLDTTELDALRAAAAGPSDVGGRSRAKLFARKFDQAAAPEILDRLDESLVGAA
jgi:Core-2/I-Branching enzyme